MNINEQIKKIALKNMMYPAIMLAVIITLFTVFPFHGTFNPYTPDSIWDCENTLQHKDYIYTTVDELYYTGYNVSQFGRKDYGYYYALNNDECIFVLIPVSDTPEETLKNYKLHGQIIPTSERSSFEDLIISLSSELNWSESGLKNISCDFIISNANYHPVIYAVVFVLLIAGIVFAFYLLCINIIHYKYTYTYNLCPHTNNETRKKLIEKAELELKENLILSVSDLYLTEHYFIEINKKNVIILPLMRIVWGYRMGTLNYKIHHKIPKYNLFFYLKSGDSAVFINKSGEDTLLILEAIRELNYGIILGYTDSKRKKAKELIKG